MKQRHRSRINWANVLTWTRLALLLPITLFAYLDMRWTVFWLIVIGSLTDIFDGKVARWSGMASEDGALLDSKIDNLAVPFFLFWVWLLYPVVYTDFLWLIIVAAGCVAMQLTAAYVKLGTVTGLHLWSNKLAALFSGFTLPVFILFGYYSWIIWVVGMTTIISQLEGTVYLLKGGKDLDARFFWEK